jgi:hypothetical protein
MATTDAEAARARVAELDWWHTIEVAPGVVTPGGWDLRSTAERLPWPPSLAGMRCLDIATMDGFWAFELERRGAGEVVASDVLDATRLDHFLADRLRGQQHRRPSEGRRPSASTGDWLRLASDRDCESTDVVVLHDCWSSGASVRRTSSETTASTPTAQAARHLMAVEAGQVTSFSSV